MSNKDIIEYYYKKTELLFKNKQWQVRFDYNALEGKRVMYDLVDAKTNDIVIKKNAKITKKLIKKLEEQNFEYALLTENEMPAYAIVEDVVDKDDEVPKFIEKKIKSA